MRIHHVAFRTHDLPRLHAFYTEVLGFLEAGGDETRSRWLRAGDAIVMLERAGENEDEPEHLSRSKELVAFAVTKAERDVLRSKLISRGFPIDGETAFTTYVRDPDGRRIAFSHYPEA